MSWVYPSETPTTTYLPDIVLTIHRTISLYSMIMHLGEPLLRVSPRRSAEPYKTAETFERVSLWRFMLDTEASCVPYLSMSITAFKCWSNTDFSDPLISFSKSDNLKLNIHACLNTFLYIKYSVAEGKTPSVESALRPLLNHLGLIWSFIWLHTVWNWGWSFL